MPKRKEDKKIIFYEPLFNDVLVCKNSDDNAYLEIFHEKPENVSLEGLGSILGIFEVDDNSEDSSYIPNYLISIIKKEFYSRPKRSSIESFEMALHKANLALSQLASQGNINWIGKLNAVCAVIEKSNFHLTQTGEMSVFLIRLKTLTNLSEEEETVITDPNPLKTFRDVLSGRLEKDDKVIMTTNAIFQIFSIDELKNASLKFSKEDFIQFLNTALVNQLERAAVLITDLEEQEKETTETVRRPMKLNAFSQDSYQKKEKLNDLNKDEEKQKLIEELKKDYQKTKGDFVDEKTGHIYIREDADTKIPENRVLGNIKSYAKSLAIGNEKNLEKIKETSNQPDQKEIIAVENTRETTQSSDLKLDIPIRRKGPTATRIALEKMKKLGLILKKNSVKVYFFLGNIIKNWVALPFLSLFKKIGLKIADFKKPRSKNISETFPESQQNFFSSLPPSRPEKNFLPDFSKIKIIFFGLDRKKKAYAALALILIFIIPYFISRIIAKMEENKKPVISEVLPPEIPLKEDKNVIRIEHLNEVYSGSGIVGIVNVKGSFFGINQESLISLTDQNIFPLPENFQNPDSFFAMDDLNLIFILKNNKLTSFSPNSKKFQENTISLPDNSKIEASGSFLTYAYFLDSQNNQLYRFPRVEGGFGSKTSWIKDEADLSSVKSLAINESIFISNNKGIQKFLKGKKEEYMIENTATPIVSDRLYTKPGSQNLYVLDKASSRVIKLESNGAIVSQYYHSEIQNSNDLAVDEESNIIYLSGENSIKSFNIN